MSPAPKPTSTITTRGAARYRGLGFGVALTPLLLLACNAILGVGELRYEADATPDSAVSEVVAPEAGTDADAEADAATDALPSCDPKWSSATPVFGSPELLYESPAGLARIAVDGDALFFGLLDDDSIPDHAKILRMSKAGASPTEVAFGVDVGPGIVARRGTLYFATDDALVGTAVGCGEASCPVLYRDPDFGSLTPIGRPFAVAGDGTLFVPLRDGRLKRLAPSLPSGEIPDPELLPEIPDEGLSMVGPAFPASAAPSAAVDETHVYLGSGLANLGVYAWSLADLTAPPKRIREPASAPGNVTSQGSLVTACRSAYLVAHPSNGTELYQLRGDGTDKLLTAQNNGPATLGVAVVGARYVYIAGFYSLPESTARIVQFDRTQTAGATLVRVNGAPPAWFETGDAGDGGGDAGAPRGLVTGLALDDDFLYVVVNANTNPPSRGRVYRLPKR